MKVSSLICHSLVCVVLVGCNAGSNNSVTISDRPESARPATGASIDVFTDQIALNRSVVNVAVDEYANILTNSTFENGLDGWTGCDGNSISISSDSYEGSSALSLGSEGCAYQSVIADAGQTYNLSCYVKLTDNKAWTGMGLLASNDNYESLLAAPTTVITSDIYSMVSTSLTTPADTSFVSLWIYSDHGAVVDSCTLTREFSVEIEYPKSELLINGDFSNLTDSSLPSNWVTGCGGSAVANGTSLALLSQACADQSVTSERVGKLASSVSEFSCKVDNVSGYADLSVFIDNELFTNEVIESSDVGHRVSLAVPAITAVTAFVSIYGDEMVEVSDCSFLVGDTEDNGEGENTSLDEPVVFASSTLEQLIREKLGNVVQADAPITRRDMLSLLDLTTAAFSRTNPSRAEVDSLVGLEYAKNLQKFWLSTDSLVSDLSPLAGLTNLELVSISELNGLIVNIDALMNLSKLKELKLTALGLKEIDAIAGLSELEKLTISVDKLQNDMPLFSDLSPVSELTKLRYLTVNKSIVTDWTPVSGLQQLEFINVEGAACDAAAFANLESLNVLYSRGSCPFSNLQALAEGIALANGGELALNVSLVDLSTNSPELIALHSLRDRGVKLSLYDASNKFTNLPPLEP